MRWISRDPILFDGGYNVYEYVNGNPVVKVDPEGTEPKNTYTEGLKKAIARGDSAEIETLLEAGGPRIEPILRKRAQDEIIQLRRTAQDILSKDCRGSVKARFPSEYKDRTFEEILRLARKGDDAAQTARKLLTERAYKK